MVKVGIEKLSLDASVLCEVPQRHKVLASLHHGVRDREERVVSFSGKVGFKLVSHMEPWQSWVLVSGLRKIHTQPLETNVSLAPHQGFRKIHQHQNR